MEAPLDPNAYVVPAIVFLCIASLSLLVYLVKTCTPRLPRPMALPLLPFRFRTRQDLVVGPKYGPASPASSEGEDEEEDEDTPKITQRQARGTPSRIERGDGHDERQRKGHVRMPTDAQIVPLLSANSRSRLHSISVGNATPNHQDGEERDPPFTVRVVGRLQGEEDEIPLLRGAPLDHGIRVAGPGRTPGLMSRSRSREVERGKEVLSSGASAVEGTQRAKGRSRTKSIYDSSPPDAQTLALEKERQREDVWKAQRRMTDASSRKSVAFEQTPRSKSRSQSRSDTGESLAMGMDMDMDEDVDLETPTQRPLRKLRSRRTGHPTNPAELVIASDSKSRSRSTLPFEDEQLPTPVPLHSSVDPLGAHALSPTSARPLRSPNKPIQSPTRAFAIRSPTKPKSLQRQLAQMPMERSTTHHPYARPLRTSDEKEGRVRPRARRALTDLDSLASPAQILSGDFDRAISFGGRDGQGRGPSG